MHIYSMKEPRSLNECPTLLSFSIHMKVFTRNFGLQYEFNPIRCLDQKQGQMKGKRWSLDQALARCLGLGAEIASLHSAPVAFALAFAVVALAFASAVVALAFAPVVV